MKRAILSNDTKGLANEVIKQLETNSMTNLSKKFHTMTDTELNQAVAKKLNIPWHEQVGNNGFCDYYKCSCGWEVHVYSCGACGQLLNHCNASNPDFTVNAKVLLEAMKEKLGEERYDNFIPFLQQTHWFSIEEFIDAYILNPRQLCEKFLDFMEG
jgi:hypothetical protein